MIRLCLIVSLTLFGCASYQAEIADFYRKLINGEASAAAESLKERAFKENDDQLVFLLEYATALHQAGQYEESTQAFLKAYDMVEIKDYHSISKITGSLLLSEGLVQYKGEDFEKVMVNVYLAINFLVMNKLESAQVEVRRINDILYKFKYEAKRPYDQNPFARYLSAIIWETDRNWDSVYIDYKNTYDLIPTFSPIGGDLLWASMKAQRPEEYKKWSAQFKDVKINSDRNNKEMGEVVFIYQSGQGPIKRPHPSWHRIPKLYPRSFRGVQAKISVQPVLADKLATDELVEFNTERVFNLEETAIKNLDDQYSEIVAKRIAGVATKAVVADQVRQKNQLLGDLTWIGLNLADQADLRQWATLPATFQIARKMLKPGKYKIRAVALDGAGGATEEVMPEKEIEISPRKKIFLTWRSFK